MMRFLVCVVVVFHTLELGGLWKLPHQSPQERDKTLTIRREDHDSYVATGNSLGPETKAADDYHIIPGNNFIVDFNIDSEESDHSEGNKEDIDNGNSRELTLHNHHRERNLNRLRRSTTSKFLGFVVGASSNSKLKADINNQLKTIEKSIWNQQSLVTKAYNVGTEKIATIRGSFVSEVITNFHGKPQEAKFRKQEDYIIHDVNALSTLFVLQCLIEANLYGAAKTATVSNVTLAISALEKFHAHAYPKGSSVLTLWPEQVKNNGDGFVINPTNLINAKVKDGSTYDQLSAISKECPKSDCPVVNKGLHDIQKIGICKEHFKKPLPTLVQDLGASPDFMTSLSNLALGSLLHAARTTPSGGKEPQLIFPAELKQWTISNGGVDNLVNLLKKSIIKFDLPDAKPKEPIHDTTTLPAPVTKPQPPLSSSSTSSSSSTKSTTSNVKTTSSLSSSTTKIGKEKTTKLSSDSSSSTSSSTLSSPHPSAATPNNDDATTPNNDEEELDTNDDADNLKKDVVVRDTDEMDDSHVDPDQKNGDPEDEKETNKTKSDLNDPQPGLDPDHSPEDPAPTDDKEGTNDNPNSDVSTKITNSDDSSQVQVNINIRVTLDTGKDEEEISSQANEVTPEKKVETGKASGKSVVPRSVKSQDMLQAIRDASSEVGIEMNDIKINSAPKLEATTLSQGLITVKQIVKDSDGNVILNKSTTSDLNKENQSTVSKDDKTKSPMELTKQTLGFILDALVGTLRNRALIKDKSKTKNTINIDIAVKNNTELIKSSADSAKENSITSTGEFKRDVPNDMPATAVKTTSAVSPKTPVNTPNTTKTTTPDTNETTAEPIATTTTTTTPSPTQSTSTTTTTTTTTLSTTTTQSTTTTTTTPSTTTTQSTTTTTTSTSTAKDTTRKMTNTEKSEALTIDSVSYFVMRKFIDEEVQVQHHDIYLIPMRVPPPEDVQDKEGDNQNDEQTASKPNESHPAPHRLMTHFSEIDLTATAISVHALQVSALSGLVDIQGDLELQAIFRSSLRMFTWFMTHQDDLLTAVRLSYFPSRFQLYWLMSRIAFQFNLTPVKTRGFFDFAQDEIEPFIKSLRAKMTLSILSSIKDGGLGQDGQTRVYLDDFIGVGDLDDKGGNKVSGDDRLFTSALAANALISTWSSPTFQSDGLLQFHSDTPDPVRIAVNTLVNYVSKKVLDPNTPLTNAHVSEKVKGCQTLPPWYPFTKVTNLSGEDVKPNRADSSLRFGVKGYILPQAYKQEEEKTRFGIKLPTVKDINDINDPTSVFRFWSSKELTKAICLLAIAQAADLKVDDSLHA